MLEAYALTLAGVALGQAAPGPNLLAVAGAALGEGRRAALFVTLGVAVGVFFWVSFAVFGLSALLAVFPAALSAMKLAGGLYLGVVAARALAAACRDGARAPTASAGAASPSTAFRRGLMVNLSNPKSALMWSAAATFLYGAGASAAQVISFAPVGALSAATIYGAYALLFSTGPARRGYARFARGAQALFGLAFGLIGGRLALEGAREIAAR